MKNPFDKLTPKAIRIIYGFAAMVVLLAGSANFYQTMYVRPTGNDQCRWIAIAPGVSRLLITDIVRGGVADRAGIVNGDTLLKINGKAFTSDQDAQKMINELAGGTARYTIGRHGTVFEANVLILKSINMTFLAQSLQGISLLLIGMIVVMARPQGKIQRMFARYGIFTFLFFTHSQINYIQGVDAAWRFPVFVAGFICASIFGPPQFFRFFLYFPVRLPAADKKWLTITLYSVAAALTAVIILGPTRLPQAAIAVAFFTRYLFITAGLAMFIYSYFRHVRPARRLSLRPVLWGVALGLAAFTYMLAWATINPFAAFLNPMILLPGLLLPVGAFMFGYAIIRYRLMDIDLIVKRSLIYGLVTASVAAVYILTVVAAGSLLSSLLGQEENQLVTIVALVLIAFVFDPIKRTAQEWIDRVFYQERYNYQKALLEFAQELPRLINLEQILQSMLQRIAGTMHIERLAIVLCDEKEGCVSVEQEVPKQCCDFQETEGGLVRQLRSTRLAQSFALLSDEPETVKLSENDKRMLIDGGIVLSVPMFLQDRLIGMINVGPKMSGKVYSKDDIDLLMTVAAQGAVAIENARLHASELEKEKIKEELSLALRIQQGLLPKGNPEIRGLEIAGISVPALTVGGDYFDFIEISKSRFLVVVADVSGKGMSAALYMSKVQGMVQLAAHMYKTPKDMLINVNRRIFDGIERRSFITMILALFDLDKKQVRICRAGHNKALIGLNGKLEYVDAPGIGLGLERGPVFEKELREVVRPLKPDSIYLFYTDGLTEAMNPKGVQFGEENMQKLVRTKRHLSSEQIQHHIVSAVEEFQGSAEQHDDLTVVVVKSHRPSPRSGKH